MGVIGDAFGKLFDFFVSLFSSLFGVIWDAIKWIGNVLWDAIKWMGGLLEKLFQGLIDILIGFFEVIYGLIDGLLYLLYMIGVLAVKLFLVIFETAKLLWALIEGFARTLASLTYTPVTSSGNGYSEILGKLFANLEVLQINSIAYISLFVLWFITALAAIKIISSIRGA